MSFFFFTGNRIPLNNMSEKEDEEQQQQQQLQQQQQQHRLDWTTICAALVIAFTFSSPFVGLLNGLYCFGWRNLVQRQ